MRGKNFLLTMLRLAKERDELKVVADQHGAPTWSRTIADISAQVLSQAHAGGREWWVQNSGVYHLSAQGQTTWYEFTQAIVEAAGLECRVLPISTADYPTPAKRPQYSVMSSERLTARFCHLPDWKDALHLCMQ
jgi:dTDP-4-dehydrorhamnose reductase